MKRYFTIIASLVFFFACSGKHLDQPDPGKPEPVVKKYVEIEATLEEFGASGPSVSFGEDAVLYLLLDKSQTAVSSLSSTTLNGFGKGMTLDVAIVSPAKSGRIMCFDGKKEIRNEMGIPNLKTGKDRAERNYEEITAIVETIREKPQFVFEMEKGEDGWLIRHKSSRMAFTNNEIVDSSSPCEWSEEAKETMIDDASMVSNSSNLVIGNPDLVYIKYQDRVLHNGGMSNQFNWYLLPEDKTFAETAWLLFDLPIKGSMFNIKDGGNGISSAFIGEEYTKNKDYYAIFPYNAKDSYDGEKITFPVARTRKYVSGGIQAGSNYCAGKLDQTSGSVLLKNLCGILQIPLKGKQTITSISIKDATGAILWGDASAKIKDGNIDYNNIDLSGGSATMVLDCSESGGVSLSEEKSTPFNITIPAGALKDGAIITISATGGELNLAIQSCAILPGKVTRIDDIYLNPEEFSTPTYSIENDIVEEYMASVFYYDLEDQVFTSGCTSYFVNEFKSRVDQIYADKEYRTDWPKGVTATWGETTSDKLRVVLSCDSKEVVDTMVNSADKSYEFINLVPGKTYNYSITDNASQLLSGEFKTKGTLRMIAMDGGWNVRDMGGMVSREFGGKPIRYEAIYRGGSPNLLTEKGRILAKQAGIKADLDLRGMLNPTDGQGSGLSADSNNIGTYSLGYTTFYDADFKQIMSDYAVNTTYNAYPALHCTALVKDVAWVIYELKQGHPVYYHCHLGADRTQAVAQTIAGLLGVAQGDIAKDYELTSFAANNSGLMTRYVTGNTTLQKCWNNMELPDGCDSLSEQMYYYLNRQFESSHINASDLDWFIEYMLGMAAGEFKNWRSGWKWEVMNYTDSLENTFSADTINK